MQLIWNLKATELFANGTDSVMSWARREVIEISFSKGDHLIVRDDSEMYVYCIVEGSVKLSTTSESGKETILDIAGPDDIFGPIEKVLEPPANPTGNESRISGEFTRLTEFASEATAISKGFAVRFELSQFRHMAENRPWMMFNISRLLGMQSTRLQLRLSRLLYRSSLGKAAGLLTELAERYGEKNSDGLKVIQFRLTHQEMASMTGLKRETVSEALGVLELEEYISTEKRQITVLRPDDLQNIQ